jgi:hypothetical protein
MAENRLVTTQGEIELRREVDALRAEVSALRQRIDSGGRLGPVPETLEQEAERTKRVADAIAAAMARDVRKDPPPPVDRTKLCTTDGRSPEEARASQTNETGQHASYIVLCDEERQKGFVRPYRDRYQHVGPLVRRGADRARVSAVRSASRPCRWSQRRWQRMDGWRLGSRSTLAEHQ